MALKKGKDTAEQTDTTVAEPGCTRLGNAMRIPLKTIC